MFNPKHVLVYVKYRKNMKVNSPCRDQGQRKEKKIKKQKNRKKKRRKEKKMFVKHSPNNLSLLSVKMGENH